MKLLITILLILSSIYASSQIVIEMSHPGDADVILLQVENSDMADIIVYKTNNVDEAAEWNCMWKFRKWGFSNFGVYITKDMNDPLMSDNEFGTKYAFNAKIYFTDDIKCRGYAEQTIGIDGVMRIHKK